MKSKHIFILLYAIMISLIIGLLLSCESKSHKAQMLNSKSNVSLDSTIYVIDNVYSIKAYHVMVDENDIRYNLIVNGVETTTLSYHSTIIRFNKNPTIEDLIDYLVTQYTKENPVAFKF